MRNIDEKDNKEMVLLNDNQVVVINEDNKKIIKLILYTRQFPNSRQFFFNNSLIKSSELAPQEYFCFDESKYAVHEGNNVK